ncbi:MAG: 6-phosphogluconolactonase [Nitrospirota bacterium]
MPPIVQVYPDAARAAAAGCEILAREIATAVAARGRAWVVLAGGRTPRAVYERLAAHAGGIAWEHTWWCFGDERWVPCTDSRSNRALVQDALFANTPIPRRQILAVPTEERAPPAGARAYEAALRAYFPGATWPAFDVVLMGLGADGHTASLFPHDSALAERAAWVTTTRVGRPVPDRVTLTIPAFAHARLMVFLVSGASKADAVAATLGEHRDEARWPAQAVMPRAGACRWLLDRDAARALTSYASLSP